MHSTIKRPAGLIAAGLLLAGVAGATVPATAAMARTGPVASFSIRGSLSAVAATSARHAWAVGSADGGRPLIARWNGSTWAQAPIPGFPGNGGLSGVAAVSGRYAWAVGTTGSGQTLILHWNGVVWGRMPSPNPDAGKTGDGLRGVAATSAGNAWAVGSTGSGKTLILHWNGHRWKQVAGSAVRGTLSAVTATSTGSAWAVGEKDSGTGINVRFRTLILHWDGTSWKQVPSPQARAHFIPFLNGVTASSAHSAWAVGDSTNCGCGPGLSLTRRWDGASWKRVPSPSPGGGTALLGVAAIPGSSSAWAAGLSGEGDSLTKTVILRWDGTAWQRVPTPAPRASSDLSGVAAVSPRLAWAVGSASNKNRSNSTTVILQWNGRAWR